MDYNKVQGNLAKLKQQFTKIKAQFEADGFIDADEQKELDALMVEIEALEPQVEERVAGGKSTGKDTKEKDTNYGVQNVSQEKGAGNKSTKGIEVGQKWASGTQIYKYTLEDVGWNKKGVFVEATITVRKTKVTVTTPQGSFNTWVIGYTRINLSTRNGLSATGTVTVDNNIHPSGSVDAKCSIDIKIEGTEVTRSSSSSVEAGLTAEGGTHGVDLNGNAKFTASTSTNAVISASTINPTFELSMTSAANGGEPSLNITASNHVSNSLIQSAIPTQGWWDWLTDFGSYDFDSSFEQTQ